MAARRALPALLLLLLQAAPRDAMRLDRRAALSRAGWGLAGALAGAGVGPGPWASQPRPASAMWQLWQPKDMLYYVEKYGKQDDAVSVLAAMDQAAETSWMMNIGPEKGAIIEELLRQRAPKKVLELGTFCGYSTIRMAQLLPGDATLVTIEKDEATYNVAKEIVAKAGLLQKTEDTPEIDMRLIESSKAIPDLQKKYRDFDFILMDHWKDLYDVDMRSMDARGMISPGAYVVADNVRFPGAPRYLDYLYNGYGALLYQTRIIEVPFEYRPDQPDAISVSIRTPQYSLDRDIKPKPQPISDRMKSRCDELAQAAEEEAAEPAPASAPAPAPAPAAEGEEDAPPDTSGTAGMTVVDTVICEALERSANDGSGVALSSQ
eukprot:CAMPEP_0118867576 /NCGR_PEP_ID=MMETSP1163-20130328/11137_1 /TAXON_ID=124430 /ORGANISM="Phaeomonas parva, Strain CCMP2877" /LENGTH=376 /DNA_ID=CAMNT_0006802003 /DNA_START=116 /DNA_END=1246 /DNA_ORIENTATION=+